MSLDGLALAAVLEELREKLINGRIDKIHQPEKDEIMLQIRQPGQNHKLVISANPQKARIQLTTLQKVNPFTPPMFCMVLRKHLEGGRIINFTQPALERMAELHVENYDELGQLSTKVLIGEFMGKHSNIVLVDPANNLNILDGIKRYSFASSQHREILPGRNYLRPPQQGKVNPRELLGNEERFKEILWDENLKNPEATVEKLLLKVLLGLSPQSCREIVVRADLTSPATIGSLGEYELNRLWAGFNQVVSGLQTGHWNPTLVRDAKGKLLAFSPIDLLQYSDFTKEHASMNEILDRFYSTKEKENILQQAKGNLLGVIKDNLNRLYKKIEIYTLELTQAQEMDNYKILGELLTANIYQIQKGQQEIEVINYYDPAGATISIPLDQQLSPSENAQYYYKKYNKSKVTQEMVLQQKEIAELNISYLESVQTSLDLASTLEEVAEIKQELEKEGLLKSDSDKKGLKNKGKDNKPKDKKVLLKPLTFISDDNFEILVGKNNKQNDYLTLRVASDDDLWFHTKNIPGSHVIIRTSGQQISDETISLAATIAAYFSKAKESANVPVDFTFKKNVHKPKGAKPGMVIYEGQKTLFVTPDETLINNHINKDV